ADRMSNCGSTLPTLRADRAPLLVGAEGVGGSCGEPAAARAWLLDLMMRHRETRGGARMPRTGGENAARRATPGMARAGYARAGAAERWRALRDAWRSRAGRPAGGRRSRPLPRQDDPLHHHPCVVLVPLKGVLLRLDVHLAGLRGLGLDVHVTSSSPLVPRISISAPSPSP